MRVCETTPIGHIFKRVLLIRNSKAFAECIWDDATASTFVTL